MDIPYHILKESQFSREFLDKLFEDASKFKWIMSYINKFRVRKALADVLRSRVLVYLFEEPSTRTNMSFQIAMTHLGGRVIGSENALEFSSLKKKETRHDFGEVCAGYSPDVIVYRSTTDDGVDKFASGVDTIEKNRPHVINAGAGKARHPTQTLLDLFTINESLGSINGKVVAMIGDLKHGRTVHSLAYALRNFYTVPEIIGIAPKGLGMPEADKEGMMDIYFETNDISYALKKADVLYVVRPQRERMGEDVDEFCNALDRFKITLELMENSSSKDKPLVMHPLPRTNEIDKAFDSDPRAIYFSQSRNGLYVRMALLKQLIRPELKLNEIVMCVERLTKNECRAIQ